MATSDEAALEDQIALWRTYVRRRPEVNEADAEELEDHLRHQVAEFVDSGLSSDEAFLVAVKRLGDLDELSREFAHVHSDRLWKQLVLTGHPGLDPSGSTRRDFLAMLGCALAASVAVKLPVLFGSTFELNVDFYLRNLSLFALPFLAAYFAWKRRVRVTIVATLGLLFGLGAVAANAFPFEPGSHTGVLTAIHLPIALWLVVGVAYAGGDWRSDRARMDFIRFTGEWFIYYVLIALGGGVLAAITIGTFDAIGMNAEQFVTSWLLPCGAAGAVVVAGWLVEHKKSVIENMAPVLTRVFTPLFSAVLLAFLVAVIWNATGVGVDRDVLIFFNLLLVVVLGLLLYGISARESSAPPHMFDWQQLALVLIALIIDGLVLVEILSRIGEWGLSPNRVAALGENAILLANLTWSAWLFVAFLHRRTPFARIDRWQTNYLVVYAAWAWAVVLVFPLVFDFA